MSIPPRLEETGRLIPDQQRGSSLTVHEFPLGTVKKARMNDIDLPFVFAENCWQAHTYSRAERGASLSAENRGKIEAWLTATAPD